MCVFRLYTGQLIIVSLSLCVLCACDRQVCIKGKYQNKLRKPSTHCAALCGAVCTGLVQPQGKCQHHSSMLEKHCSFCLSLSLAHLLAHLAVQLKQCFIHSSMVVNAQMQRMNFPVKSLWTLYKLVKIDNKSTPTDQDCV